MHCYVKDFGSLRLAVCEQQMPGNIVVTVSEHLSCDPSPDLWARLGALIARSGEILEAQ